MKVCDKCGQEAAFSIRATTLVLVDRDNAETVYDEKPVDLCKDCFTDFKEIVSHFMTSKCVPKRSR